VQSVHDSFTASGKALEHPFAEQAIADVTKQVISDWTNKRGVSVKLTEAEVTALVADVDHHWSEDERETFLKRLDASYEPFRHAPAEKKAKGKGKAKDTEAGG
jgi:CRISPR-associated protein Csc2